MEQPKFEIIGEDNSEQGRLKEAWETAQKEIPDKELKMVMDATANHKDPESLQRYLNANKEILSPQSQDFIEISIRLKKAEAGQ